MRRTLLLTVTAALLACAPASAATINVPGQYPTFAAAYQAAQSGDTIQVADGTYPRQDIPAGSKAVTFKGGPGVKVRQLWVASTGATFDGINIDGAFVRKETGLQLRGARNTFKNASVGNIADEKNIVDGDGQTFDNVRFHDVVMTPTGEREGIHMECLYSLAPNITIRDSRFENCAVMDVFFTRGTWYGQPEYGGWTLTGNYFDAPRFTDGECCHYYAVSWAWQSRYDRAVVRGNTYKAGVAATDMNGADATFTSSVESCNTPTFGLRGMARETCAAEPPPTPTPSPTATPTPEPTVTPTPSPQPPSYDPACRPDCDQSIADLRTENARQAAELEAVTAERDALAQQINGVTAERDALARTLGAARDARARIRAARAALRAILEP